MLLFYRGYSLIGKTAILHIVISGSSPDNSTLIKVNIWFLFAFEKLNPVEQNIEAVFVISSNLISSNIIYNLTYLYYF
jgi:ferric iron reductase protein FhuF